MLGVGVEYRRMENNYAVENVIIKDIYTLPKPTEGGIRLYPREG